MKEGDKKAPPPQEGSQDAAPEQAGGWAYTGAVPDQSSPDLLAATPDQPAEPGVVWTASEYISHQKGIGWYAGLFGAVVAIVGVVFLLTRDFVSSFVIGFFGLVFALFAAREPDVLEYAVDSKGVYVGQRFYPYNLFRSFTMLNENAIHSIYLMPQKRFSLPITVYYDPKDEPDIVNVIGSHLPHEDRTLPAVDRVMGKIHF